MYVRSFVARRDRVVQESASMCLVASFVFSCKADSNPWFGVQCRKSRKRNPDDKSCTTGDGPNRVTICCNHTRRKSEGVVLPFCFRDGHFVRQSFEVDKFLHSSEKLFLKWLSNCKSSSATWENCDQKSTHKVNQNQTGADISCNCKKPDIMSEQQLLIL